MNNEERIELIKRGVAEILTEEDLRELIKQKVPLKHYIGFEISGKIHLGTGLMCGKKIADFQKAGIDCSCYLATWHAWINNKLGGDLDTIRKASEYFKEGLKISIDIMGGDSSKVKFITGDELYHNNDKFWLTVIEIAKHTTLKRALRSITIMGRKEGEDVGLAALFYAPMQVADIFIQQLNIAHAGLDQRKAQVIAREVAEKLKISPLKFNNKIYKPVAIHHPLIMGLLAPPEWPIPKEKLDEFLSEMKMSKSVPGSAVFITDTPEEIKQKLNKAFCPIGDISYNPIINWCEQLIFINEKSKLEVKRPAKFGGNKSYASLEQLKKDFVSKKLHPMDLKNAVAEYLIRLLEPARKHFEKPKLKKLKEEIETLSITR